jgi:L-asparaginase
MTSAVALPRVGLVLTGGTIDSLGVDRLDMAWYIEANKRLGDGELIARIPEVGSIAHVEEFRFRRMPSHALVSSDLIELSVFVNDIFQQGVDGVVITHGTNTLEETAFFLNLVLKTARPVIITGAMRPASAISADGDLNLVNAIRLAASSSSVGLGVLIAMNGTILSARDATKTNTYSVAAFQAPEAGPLGVTDADGRVVIRHRPARPHTTQSEFDVRLLKDLPRVDVVVSYIGADGAMIDAAVAAGSKGIVSAGTGAGRPTPAEEAAFVRATERGVLICQASRVGAGRVVRGPSLVRKGWVASGDLQPWKARVLLSLALTTTADPEAIQAMFDRY